jgi:hypothetical protein
MMSLPAKVGALAAILTAAACATDPVFSDSSSGTHQTASVAGSSGAGGSTLGCVPGQQIECGCPHGTIGAQVCAADGKSYGLCTGCDSGNGGGGSSTTTTTSSTTTGATSASSTTSGAGGATSSSVSSSTGAGAGPPCAPGPIDLNQVTIYSNPPDLASWPETTTLTEVDFTNDGVHVEFSKIDGTGRWPDVVPPGWAGPLQYTIGMVECIQGQWYTSAVIEVWYGLQATGGNVAQDDQVAMNWYYDPNRWGLLAGRQPATGETIGIFVAAGNLRNITTDDPAQSPVMERSNVVLVPMPDVNGATHSF